MRLKDEGLEGWSYMSKRVTRFETRPRKRTSRYDTKGEEEGEEDGPWKEGKRRGRNGRGYPESS
jgi:hypothetical protein